MIETVSPVEQMCITRGQLKGTKAQIRSRGEGGEQGIGSTLWILGRTVAV